MLKFLKANPFVRLLIPWIIGILVQYHLPGRIGSAVILLTVFLILYFVAFLLESRYSRIPYSLRWVYGFILNLLLLTLSYSIADHHYKEPGACSESWSVYRLSVQSEIQLKPKTVRFIAKTFNDSLDPETRTVQLSLTKDNLSASLSRGDEILVYGQMRQPGPPQNPEGFDQQNYFRNKGIDASLWAGDRNWKIIRRAELKTSYVRKIRDWVLGRFDKMKLKPENQALLQALVLGDKTGLDEDQKLDFSAAGAMHVLAVSGLHVGLVYLIFGSILNLIFRKRKYHVLSSIGVLVLLWIYAAVTGMSPSVVRASTMFSFVAVGRLFRQKSQMFNTLSMVAFLLLFFQPANLTDVGFQLSFSAVLGILVFQPKITGMLEPRSKLLKWIWELFAVSISAQLGTLPLSLYYFHQFPNYFLLTNLILIPLTTLLIYGAIFSLFLTLIPGVSGLCGWIMNLLLKLMNESAAWVGEMPGSVSRIYIDSFQTLVLAISIALLAGWVYGRKYRFLAFFLMGLVVFMSFSVYRQFRFLQDPEMIVYYDRKYLHLDFFRGNNHQVFTENEQNYRRLAKNYLLKHSCNSETVVPLDTLKAFSAFQFSGKKIVVIGKEAAAKFRKIPSQADAPMFIIHPAVGPYYRKMIVNDCKQKGIACFSIEEKGSYIRKIFSNFAVF